MLDESRNLHFVVFLISQSPVLTFIYWPSYRQKHSCSGYGRGVVGWNSNSVESVAFFWMWSTFKGCWAANGLVHRNSVSLYNSPKGCRERVPSPLQSGFLLGILYLFKPNSYQSLCPGSRILLMCLLTLLPSPFDTEPLSLDADKHLLMDWTIALWTCVQGAIVGSILVVLPVSRA